MKLEDVLIKHNVAATEELHRCALLALEEGRPLEEIVIEQAVATEHEVLGALARESGIPFLVAIERVDTPEEYVKGVPVTFSRRHGYVALGRHNGAMIVATSRPLATNPFDELVTMLGCPVRLVAAPSHVVTRLIDQAYREKSTIADEVFEEFREDEVLREAQRIHVSDDLMDVATKGPIVRLVNMILFKALKQRATDIHVQPFEDVVRVRYRVDGILYDVLTLPKHLQEAIASRVKVMARMDIAEKRMAQDGRTTVTIGKDEIDLRISVVPVSYGERVVLRLLDKSARLFTLEELGVPAASLHTFRQLIHLSHGILFVTGPTGSGKTTTLNAAMISLNSAEKNIITLEDPIEYQIPGVSQIQVNPKKGLTFASGLRSVLRQDPDVVMVGEVRDLETARMAIQSAQTGHLVFSTVHTNDSPGALVRLLDLGIEPYLVASSLIAVMAQRLIRLVCPYCKEAYPPTDDELRILELSRDGLTDGVLWRGPGCGHCMGTGYYERTGIYELLVIDDDLREMIMRMAPSSEVKRVAVEQKGLVTLRMDARTKVLTGRTTMAEGARVTQRDTF